MKTKDFYISKIAKAKSDIEKWELSIYHLDNPIPLKPSKEKTKIISFRVPENKAEQFRKDFTKHLLEKLKS